MSTDILTTEEVADLLRVSLRVVRSLRSSGALPGIRIGKELRFRRSDVLALLEKGTK